MKRILAVIMAVMLVLSLAACGGDTKTETKTDDTANTVTEAKHYAALDVLNTVWAAYPEEAKFPVAGGDFSEENANWEGPGKHSVEGEDNTANLIASYQFPEAELSKINDAATVMHAMMANNFCCGAYNVTNAEDITAVAEALKESLANAQWMCGQPEGYVVITLGDCVIAYYGLGEVITNFTTALTTAYPDAVVVCNEAIAA